MAAASTTDMSLNMLLEEHEKAFEHAHSTFLYHHQKAWALDATLPKASTVKSNGTVKGASPVTKVNASSRSEPPTSQDIRCLLRYYHLTLLALCNSLGFAPPVAQTASFLFRRLYFPSLASQDSASQGPVQHCKCPTTVFALHPKLALYASLFLALKVENSLVSISGFIRLTRFQLPTTSEAGQTAESLLTSTESQIVSLLSYRISPPVSAKTVAHAISLDLQQLPSIALAAPGECTASESIQTRLKEIHQSLTEKVIPALDKAIHANLDLVLAPDQLALSAWVFADHVLLSSYIASNHPDSQSELPQLTQSTLDILKQTLDTFDERCGSISKTQASEIDRALRSTRLPSQDPESNTFV